VAWTRRERQRRRRGVRQLAAVGVVLAVVGVIGGFELQARQAEGQGFELPGPGEEDLKVLLRTQDELNAHGYRDVERQLAPRPGVPRVAVLGDSVAFGQSVASHQAFPRVTDSLLEGIEVLNLGQTGFDIQQVTALARHRLPAWRPDLVVYAFHTNDRVETRLVRVGDRARPLHVATGLSPPLRWLRSRSAMVRLYLGARAARQLARDGVPGEAEQARFFQTWAPRLVEAVGPDRLLVFTVPHHRLAAADCGAWSGDPAQCSADEAALAQATALFEGLGVPVLAGRPALAELGPDALVIHADPHHPSVSGHARLARVLAQALAQRLSPLDRSD